LGAAAAGAACENGRARRLPPRRLLAADGYAARQDAPRKPVVDGSAVEMLVSSDRWKGRKVLVTGHTGFKGGWLSLWLNKLGANVTGFSLPAPTEPSLFEQTRLSDLVRHVEGDVRDLATVQALVRETEPEMVFHLAAQPLVRYSYDAPVETFGTNIMGTVHVLEACRSVDSVKGIVCVTSDKCY